MSMRVLFAAAIAAASVSAGTASASIMLPSSAAQATQISDTYFHNRAVTVVYTGIPGPYSAFAAAQGPIGTDDYTTTQTGTFNLAAMRFVGGVSTAGNTIDFEFLDATNTVVNSFGISFAQAGDFIWTVTLAPGDGSTSTFAIPAAGTIRASVREGGAGRWFFTTTAPTIGSNDFAVGAGAALTPQRNQAFELTDVPAPGSMALLGLGGLVALRRRR
jgi:MYXO-CTERM domain-containing protein